MMPKKPEKMTIETLKHTGANRPNIPTAELQSVMTEAEIHPIRKAYRRRDPDLDPQLIWRGKDVENWSDLVVPVPPLYIQEKIHPKVIIDDLMRRSRERAEADQQEQLDLFSDFNGISDSGKATEFYQHAANWTNRMILGDSLQVMASLAEREGLRGKVQCIYIDPPYGIRFNSNFQWSTTSRDVKDGKTDHITREPEQVKAFRDTWRDGIHSYLTYLRDRLTVARELLVDSGSCFVQIGDENVHRVRALMDEVFGDDNFVSEIIFLKTTGKSSGFLDNNFDILLWYSKDKPNLKFRRAYFERSPEEDYNLRFIQDENYDRRRIRESEVAELWKKGADFFRPNPLTSQTPSATIQFEFQFENRSFNPGKRGWSTNEVGMSRLAKADRLIAVGNTLSYVRFLRDAPMRPHTSFWTDTRQSGFGDEKLYVVQTARTVIERCILMTTDPGDLVLDPTCGSGTTAYVAEQWGRRWITIDTSRVALALARARIMGARYPYYLLADSPEGREKEAEITRTPPPDAPAHGDIRQGFVYERVPHITLKSIANNEQIDEIWEEFQKKLEPLRADLNKTLKQKWQEWEIPREADEEWPSKAVTLHRKWWKFRIKRQQEIDAAIAAIADFEFLYDKPFEARSVVRVAGPFTVESLSPHRVIAVDEQDELMDPDRPRTPDRSPDAPDFAAVILEHLRTAGVQQAHKEDKITFTAITGWPGRYICAEGRYMEADSETERRAGIFIGPEFGTVARADLVAAVREAGDAGFDVLIACAFNFDAHSAEFDRLGRVPILKARMNADLHMSADLKNTGAGNLFVIFGEPDIEVVSGLWLVDSKGRMVANYGSVAELSGAGSLEEINRLGCEHLSSLGRVPTGRKVRADEPDSKSGGIRTGKHRGGSGKNGDRRVSPEPERGQRLSGRSGNISPDQLSAGNSPQRHLQGPDAGSRGNRSDAYKAKTIAALAALQPEDFPLKLTTSHYSQITIHGVDVFHPNSGEVYSSGPEGIACWFIDNDYNEESFFVRQAYFLGANDPYRSLKTTLKAEIDREAWESLYSDTSRVFEKPKSGRIAVKVINHLGDEVMKVFAV